MSTAKFDPSSFGPQGPSSRYLDRISQLKQKGKHTQCIESAVSDALSNIKNSIRSFVIFGEPQSGKTEMMLALTAKLLDDNHRIILILLNDNVSLLDQNFERFSASGLAPAPRRSDEVCRSAVDLHSQEWVVFCKKNAKDLNKLIRKLAGISNLVIVDDEADFASPNAKINRNEKTRINALVEQILGTDGIYIGVTATPARLDLNNTFRNDHEAWVCFGPHPLYNGSQDFFPDDFRTPSYRLTRFDPNSSGFSPQRMLENAVLSFMTAVAHVNLTAASGGGIEQNFSMLVHTSGKQTDHVGDSAVINSVQITLSSRAGIAHARMLRRLWQAASTRYPQRANEIVSYILRNVTRNRIITLNCRNPNPEDSKAACSPNTLFTFVVGGNIVSRGVTFDNLLSMFFTRDVRTRFQQDTYIQRARMFGTRGGYLREFELTIPNGLFADWHSCFVLYRLSIENMKSVKQPPVWLERGRIAAAAPSSVDRANVAMDSGEMSFAIFNFPPELEGRWNACVNLDDVEAISREIGPSALPSHILGFLRSQTVANPTSLALHPASTVAGYKDPQVAEQIARSKGFMGRNQLELNKYPNAVHHLKIFTNHTTRIARVFYKYTAPGTVRMLRHTRGRP